MKRDALALFTAVALLTQGLAWASVVPAMAFAKKADAAETAVPCHTGEATDAKDNAAMPCCDNACDCADVCAGHAAAVLPSFSFAAPLRADLHPASFTGLRLSINHHERLRPPIASQS